MPISFPPHACISELGQELEAIHPVANRALVAFTSGDLPAALAFLDAATPGFLRLKVPTTELRIDRCAVLLAAGLAADALAEADAAVREIEQIRGWSTKKARTAADGGQLRAGSGPAADRPGLGAGRVSPVPVAAQRLVAGACGARARPGALRSRPGVARVAPPGEPGGRPAGCPRRRRRGASASAGRANCAETRPPRRRRTASGSRGPDPTARSGPVTGQRLARRGAASRGCGPSGPDAGRLPSGAGRPG